MKKALKIIGVLGVLFIGGLLVLGVLGFVGYRNMVPSMDKNDVPETVGNFKLRKAFPPKGNIWGTETRYFAEYESKTDLGDQAFTYSLNKFNSESSAVTDFESHSCNRSDLEKSGALKDKSGNQVGDFTYCGGTLHFRNKTNSVTMYNFILTNSTSNVSDEVIIDFVKNLSYNADLDLSGFASAYPSIKTEESVASTTTSDSKSTTSTSPPSGDVLSAFELAKKHKASKNNVSQYNGKEITIRGYILVPPTITEPTKGGLSSLGEKTEGVEGTINTIACWFDSKEEAKFAALKGDQYITVKGVFDGEYLAELRPCQLVKAE